MLFVTSRPIDVYIRRPFCFAAATTLERTRAPVSTDAVCHKPTPAHSSPDPFLQVPSNVSHAPHSSNGPISQSKQPSTNHHPQAEKQTYQPLKPDLVSLPFQTSPSPQSPRHPNLTITLQQSIAPSKRPLPSPPDPQSPPLPPIRSIPSNPKKRTPPSIHQPRTKKPLLRNTTPTNKQTQPLPPSLSHLTATTNRRSHQLPSQRKGASLFLTHLLTQLTHSGVCIHHHYHSHCFT